MFSMVLVFDMLLYILCALFFVTLALYGAVTNQHGWFCLITPMPQCYLITLADNAPYCHWLYPYICINLQYVF